MRVGGGIVVRPFLGYARSMSERNERGGMLVGGIIVTGVGVLFLLAELGIIPQVRRMWPLFPIIVGVALIVGSFRKPGPGSAE